MACRLADRHVSHLRTSEEPRQVYLCLCRCIQFEVAVLIVGTLMISYVLFGGMIATTWVQIIKACLLLGGATILVIMTMSQFGFSYGALFGKVQELYGQKVLEP